MQKELEVLQRNKILEKKKNKSLQKLKDLKQENKNMQEKVQILKPLIDKLTLSSIKLELILRNQKKPCDKAEIDYNSSHKNRFSANHFSAPTTFSKSNIVYYCCNKIEHKAYECNLRKKYENKVKKT